MNTSMGYDTATDCSDAASPQKRTITDTNICAGTSFHSSDIHSNEMYEM